MDGKEWCIDNIFIFTIPSVRIKYTTARRHQKSTTVDSHFKRGGL